MTWVSSKNLRGGERGNFRHGQDWGDKPPCLGPSLQRRLTARLGAFLWTFFYF